VTGEGLTPCLNRECVSVRWQEMEETIKTLQQELDLQRRFNRELRLGQGARARAASPRERDLTAVRVNQAQSEQEKERLQPADYGTQCQYF